MNVNQLEWRNLESEGDELVVQLGRLTPMRGEKFRNFGDGSDSPKSKEIPMKAFLKIAALVVALGASIATAQAMSNGGDSRVTTGDIMTKSYTGR